MASQKTVIFLDVDGVLVPVSPMCFGGGDIETACVQRLKSIVDACGGAANTTIVISSTWRHDEEKKKRLNASFAQVGGIPQATRGVPDGVANPTVVTYLKKNPSEQKLVRDRVDEIYDWLETNQAEFPEAKHGGRWFAIDDMDLGVDERMKGHFVKTDIEEGLLPADVQTATNVVNAFAPYTAPSAAAAAAAEPAAQAEQPAATAPVVPGKKPIPALPTQLQPDVEYRGRVKRYNPFRGFGFITAFNGEELFVHQSAIAHSGFRGLNEREPVAFFVSFDDPQPPQPSSSGPEEFPLSTKKAVKVRQLTPYIPAVVPHSQQHLPPADPSMMMAPPPSMHMIAQSFFPQIPLEPFAGGGLRAPNGCVYYTAAAPPPPPFRYNARRDPHGRSAQRPPQGADGAAAPAPQE